MQSGKKKWKIIKTLIGFLLIFIGAFFNRILAERFFPPYVAYIVLSIFPGLRWNLILIVLGIVLLLIEEKHISSKKLIEIYRFCSITLLTTVIIFILVNITSHLYLQLDEIFTNEDPINLKYLKIARPLYPDFTEKEILDIIDETGGAHFTYTPYSQFKYKPYKGKYLNISPEGYRLVKNQCPWPLNKNYINVFVFGGSTTYGVRLTDSQTIPSYLQEYFSNSSFDKNICVYNYGRGYYFSSLEQVLFAKRIREAVVPDLAIFIDGLNDLTYTDEAPIFTKHFEEFVEILESGKLYLYSLPVTRWINHLTGKFTKTPVNEMYALKDNDEKEHSLEAIKERVHRYIRNKKIIEGVARAFDVKTLFVWQPVPYYKYDLQYHLFAEKEFKTDYIYKLGYPYMKEYAKRHNLGNNFLWIADMQENLKKPLYVDDIHYSQEMTELIAKKIYEFLQANKSLYLKKGSPSDI
jgi:lysophospholipase L1-like esterase